ncbi:transposase [Sutterella sp.]|uniref:transposase n=1 Tax=Sutterella sp. TaxID=1981025 RepID=UPI0026DEBC11|nr:transposase [Sutterella sp.]MDO5530685.1 transposase [Sutterella sp.]
MSARLRTLDLYPDSFGDDIFGLAPLSLNARDSYLEHVIGNKLITAESIHASEKKLAGMIVSSIVECELLMYLKQVKQAGITDYRNGYVERRLSLGGDDITVQISRDRRGSFEPSFVHRYSRDLRVDIADLLALACAEGYSEEELNHLRDVVYRDADSELPQNPDQFFSILRRHYRNWTNTRTPQFVRLVSGWSLMCRHRCGMVKLIVGVSALMPNGRLAGIRAEAGSPADAEMLVDRLISRTGTVNGIQTPMIFVAPKGDMLFRDAVRRHWPGTLVVNEAPVMAALN